MGAPRVPIVVVPVMHRERYGGGGGRGEMVGDKGTAREEEGILFVQSLDGGQRLRLMALPPPPPSCKLQKPLL